MSISVSTRQAYTEIDNFIELLDEYNKNKIPEKLREYFKREKDKEHVKIINPNQPIKEQSLKKETLALIALLNLQYWCEDENEKQRLINIYKENEIRHQEELKEKYNPNNLFKNKQKAIEENIKETAMIEYKKENILDKIKIIINDFIKKLK